MAEKQTSGWKWLVEHEAYTIAIITLAAYMFTSGWHMSYLGTLGVPSAGAISLQSYISVLPGFLFAGMLFYVVFRWMYSLSGIPDWKLFISGWITMTLVVIAIIGMVSRSILWGLGWPTTWIPPILILVSFTLLARAYVMIEGRMFAPATYALVMLCCWSLGTTYGQRIATTRTDWRVIEIEGDEATYLVLDERDGQVIVAPLVEGEEGVYEKRFLYFDRATTGLSETINTIGPVRPQEDKAEDSSVQ